MSIGSQKIIKSGLRDVTITGGFWKSLQDTNREITIPHQFEKLRETHRLESLKGHWTKDANFTPHPFWDSDVAKWLEAAAYALGSGTNEALEARCDEIIADLARLQSDDGYLNSFFIQVEPDNRWRNVRDNHELYCAGHFMEAAIAYYQATGKRSLLDVMRRNADHIARVFGREKGKKRGYPGHPEIELALVKLYHATGVDSYLSLSKYFLDERGMLPRFFDDITVVRPDDLQAHKGVREQDTAEGHAVRACYLYAGMADVARETGDDGLVQACRALWRNITQKRMAIHGGVGTSLYGERFTFDYDLPNEATYAETCAAVALAFFAQRMFLLDPKSEYIDVLERVLYNGVICGVSRDGRRFFYNNYLESRPPFHEFAHLRSPDRQSWFGVACCPPNLARLIASVGAYLFASSADDLWINLYADCAAEVAVGDADVSLSVATRYPWDGTVHVAFEPARPADFALRLRIPSWCRRFELALNKRKLHTSIVDGFAEIRRTWHAGDVVELSLDMKAERVCAHPSVRQDTGRVALQRGPLLYCLEEVDNGKDLNNLFLPANRKLHADYEKDFLGGTVTISGEGLARSYAGWADELYQYTETLAEYEPRPFKAIPYFLWNNRGVGEMLVWLHSLE